LLEIIGQEHAHTLLRQSLRYCVKSERDRPNSAQSDEPRALLAKLLDERSLLNRPAGARPAVLLQQPIEGCASGQSAAAATQDQMDRAPANSHSPPCDIRHLPRAFFCNVSERLLIFVATLAAFTLCKPATAIPT
jgi:hypothetical protein